MWEKIKRLFTKAPPEGAKRRFKAGSVFYIREFVPVENEATYKLSEHYTKKRILWVFHDHYYNILGEDILERISYIDKNALDKQQYKDLMEIRNTKLWEII